MAQALPRPAAMLALAALALGACALRSAPGVEADAREIADAVMEKLHPHQRELDSEIEKGLDEIAVNEPTSWRSTTSEHDVSQMQTHSQMQQAETKTPALTAPAQEATAKEIAEAVVAPVREAKEAIDKGLDEIAVNEPASWRGKSDSILSQIPDEPDAAKKVYYTLSGEPLPGSPNATSTAPGSRGPNPTAAQGPWGEQIGCPHCGDTSGNCDCNEDHAKPAGGLPPSQAAAAQPATAFLRSKEAKGKHPAA